MKALAISNEVFGISINFITSERHNIAIQSRDRKVSKRLDEAPEIINPGVDSGPVVLNLFYRRIVLFNYRLQTYG